MKSAKSGKWMVVAIFAFFLLTLMFQALRAEHPDFSTVAYYLAVSVPVASFLFWVVKRQEKL
ncbi:hypothetical protein D5S17_20055 [Pseudonocardiaceae bacterium YIM PH 21723]|nr:hypothetical protein D5S17_20055 [Pseudonocardiaceae bacterium YIM PH 21723]